MIPLLDPYAAIGWDFDGTLTDHGKANLNTWPPTNGLDNCPACEAIDAWQGGKR